MNHSLRALSALCAVALGCVLVSNANAQDKVAPKKTQQVAAHQTPLAANLFYNYYTQGANNQVNAQMYLAPRPVPAYVGHSYYTYQPLMPHEHMYSHVRNYYKWYAGPEAFYNQACNGHCPGGGLNKTTVVWSSNRNYVGPLVSSLAPFNRWHYRIANHWYCPETAKKALNPYGANLRLRGSLRGGCAGGNCGGSASGNCGSTGGCASGGSATKPNPFRLSR